VLKEIVTMMLAGLTLAARAQTASNPPPKDLPLIPENVPLLTESMLWQQEVTVRAGAGYNDNVLSSPTNALGSPFMTAGLDYSLTRLPLRGWGVDLFITGDSLRYLENVPTDGEDLWVASVTVKKYFAGVWQLGLEAREAYVDDVQYGVFSNGVYAAEIRGNFLTARPFVRRDLGSNWWVQADFTGRREYVAAPLDNAWQFGPGWTAGFTRDTKTELELNFQLLRTDNETMRGLAPGGKTATSSPIDLWQETVEFRWRQHWDNQDRWTSDSKLGFESEQDNGGGYFNYNEPYLLERLRFDNKHWRLALTTRAGYQQFPGQRTDLTTGSLLNIFAVRAGVHLERRLSRRFKLYAEYNFQRALSNQHLDAYQENDAAAGAIFEY
jgi:hypothetical protein